MKILIIEDDKIKIERLGQLLSDYKFDIKESFQSGINALKNENYDLLILDMTIPLWDKDKNDVTQSYEQFGGEKILRELKRKRIILPVILFTMFDKFSNNGNMITFNQINEKYKIDFPFYIDGIYYDPIEETWKNKLLKLIHNINES